MLVIDASALASSLMPDETGVDLAAMSARHDVFTARSLLRAELRNILVVAERRGRIDRESMDVAIAMIDDLGIRLDHSPSNAAVIGLCRRHGLAVYDALYLDLALREEAELATLDAALARTARMEGVQVA